MAYDEKLAEHLRDLLADEKGSTEKKMFGGLGFLLHGNLTLSASGRGGLLVRIDPAEAERLLKRPHVSLMRMRRSNDEGLGHRHLRGPRDQERPCPVGQARTRLRRDPAA